LPKIAESIQIAAAPTEVFRFCHDMKRRPNWDERVDRIELQGFSNVLRRGALIRVDSRAGGQLPYSWEGEYTQFRVPQGSNVRVMESAEVSHFAPGSTEEWQFEPSQGGTRFTIIWTYETRGFLGLVYDRLFRRSALRRSISSSLENVKQLLESA
jgi:uncharacterized protein YndB with AHSA1/START domain